jgi:20S proteasome alpha/beta subunit
MTPKPWDRLPWRKPVTVCIAARCKDNDEHAIVTVSDTKLSTGHYSGEMATLKIRRIRNNWRCLIAGTFPHHVPLLKHISDAIGDDAEYDQTVKACTDAFIAENKKLAEETVLATFGLTLKQFLKSRSALGDSLYERTWAEISRIKVNCQLLICGFDPEPHIFVAENPDGDKLGFITNCDFPGFSAIGSGYYLAESKLYELRQNPSRSLVETLYITILAKFVAEAATDVGEETYVQVFTKEHAIEIDNTFTLVGELRDRWKQHASYKIPEDAEKIIIQHVKTASEIKPSTSQKSASAQ